MTRDTAPATEERQRDADRSQGMILAAARDESAKSDPSPVRAWTASLKRIGGNKRLIYSCFEVKERLFQAVLEQRVEHSGRRMATVAASGIETISLLVKLTEGNSRLTAEAGMLSSGCGGRACLARRRRRAVDEACETCLHQHDGTRAGNLR